MYAVARDSQRAMKRIASEPRKNDLKGFKGFHLKYGPSQGHDLALAVFHVPSPLDSGKRPSP